MCQAKCLFCVYPKLRRPHAHLSLDLYRRIVDEAATIARIDHFTLTGLGETLLDPHIVERVRYARRTLPPLTLVDLYTNGNLLRPATTDALFAAGLSVLYVSLNAINGAQRRAIMGLDDYDRVVGYTRYAIEVADRLKRKVYVKAIGSKDLMEQGQADTFQAQWGGAYTAGGHAFIHLEGNWAGEMWPIRVAQHDGCARALNQIMVLADGRVALCCHDGQGEEILGDLRTQTLREIYNGGRALEVRQAHATGQRDTIPICARCTTI